MKFLCDVHISYKVVSYLRSKGFEAVHVNDILDRWHTKDDAICQYADEHGMAVVSKDMDFKNSFLIKGSPQKLIKLNLGNLSNSRLIELFSENLEAIIQLQKYGSFMLELNKDSSGFIYK